MNPKLIELHRQRGRLQERIAQQRTMLAGQLKPVLDAERLGQRGLHWTTDALEHMKSQPWSVALVVIAVLLVRPRRLWRGVRLGFWLWRRYRKLRELVPQTLWSAFAGKR